MVTNIKEQGDLFSLLGSKLKKRLECFVIGGSAMLYFGAKEVTKDIDIVFTGLRPGEKISEELFTTEEESVMTSHRKIYIANKQSKLNDIELKNIISRLYKFLDNPEKLKSILREYISFN